MSSPSTFVLLPGAGGASEYWQRVVPLLEAAGHEAIAVGFPGSDESKGLDDYAACALAAIAKRKDVGSDVVVVAQSLGGFTAPLVATRAADVVRGIVFVNAMIPRPDETPGAWWGNTGSEAARVARAESHGYATSFDLATYFLHDLPRDVADEVMRDSRSQSKRIFGDRCRFDAWPKLPLHVIAGVDDRFFPCDFQHRIAKERLGADVPIEDIRGGHLVALSNPTELAERLVHCRTQ